MKPVYAIAVGLALVGLTARVSADDKKKEPKGKESDVVAKLLGSWEIVKADEASLVGLPIEFKKDGKYVIEKDGNQFEGEYKIDENGKLVTSRGASSDTDTIKKLTADVLELENSEGKATTMKRKK